MCLSPLMIKNPRRGKFSPYGEYMPVPCGQCVECLRNNISANIGRLLCQIHTKPYDTLCNVFFTFTIDDNIEKVDCFHEGVQRRHVQKFQRACNKYNREHAVKLHYCITSEYGTKGDRPHYHGILFGCPDIHFAEQFLHKNYDFGFVTFRVLDMASIRYTANSHISKQSHVPYMTVKDTYEDGTPFLFQQLANKPFFIASRGLGSDYIALNWKRIYHDGLLYFDGMAFPLHPTAVDLLRRSHHLDSTALLWYDRKIRDRYRDDPMYLGFKISNLKKLGIKDFYNYDNVKSLSDAIQHAIEEQSREYKNTFINKKQI